LEVHHIIPIHKGGDEWDEDNCITHCDKCHKKKHKKKWREPGKGQVELDVQYAKNTLQNINYQM